MPKRKGINSLIPSKDKEGEEEEESKEREAGQEELGNRSQTSKQNIENTEKEKNIDTDSQINLKEGTSQDFDSHTSQSKKEGEDQSVFQIEIDKIKPNPYQPRKEYDEDSLKELADSIREVGIIQPLVVSKKEIESDQGREVEYQLISGERRWRASKKIGLKTLPAIIKDININTDKLSVALIENVQRSDLSPIEEARAYSQLQDEFNLTQREIATKVGKSRSSIANSLRLLNLPSKMQRALNEGEINESQARLLLSMENPSQQEEIFKGLVEGRLDTRQAKKRKKETKNTQNKKKVHEKKFQKGKNTNKKSKRRRFWENKLEAKLSAPVQIKKKDKGGKLIIKFFSQEEWKGLLNRILEEDV
ncbi:MAG: ParB/RepB/Spo0J family partition protein [Candidatus Magasanikbacteria bacterium]